MSHDFKQLPVGVELGAPTGPVARQTSPVACEAGIVAIDGVASDFSRHGTRCTAQMMGDNSDRVSRFHHHDNGSVFSRKMAIAVVHGNTVPDGSRVALGH